MNRSKIETRALEEIQITIGGKIIKEWTKMTYKDVIDAVANNKEILIKSEGEGAVSSAVFKYDKHGCTRRIQHFITHLMKSPVMTWSGNKPNEAIEVSHLLVEPSEFLTQLLKNSNMIIAGTLESFSIAFSSDHGHCQTVAAEHVRSDGYENWAYYVDWAHKKSEIDLGDVVLFIDMLCATAYMVEAVGVVCESKGLELVELPRFNRPYQLGVTSKKHLYLNDITNDYTSILYAEHNVRNISLKVLSYIYENTVRFNTVDYSRKIEEYGCQELNQIRKYLGNALSDITSKFKSVTNTKVLLISDALHVMLDRDIDAYNKEALDLLSKFIK